MGLSDGDSLDDRGKLVGHSGRFGGSDKLKSKERVGQRKEENDSSPSRPAGTC